MAVDTATAPSTSGGAKQRGGLFKFLFVHEIDEYPANGKRTAYLALAVLATIVLYYTYYTQTGVTPNILVTYHMSFSFYVWIVVVSNAIGAFASLPASKTDKLGRSNVVIYGLLIIGILIIGVKFCTTEWQFATVICVLGLVEGAILVATPALVRDFSPQLGRASAMGFWTVGPVAGSLITSIVAAHTLSHFLIHDPLNGWKSQFVISGISALVVFVLALFLMKDLSARLRDQLMVNEQDRALVEAKARGLSAEEVIAATAHPWRQILKWDLVGSALGISVFLLLYYAASAFFTIYWATVFKNPNGLNLSTAQANDLNTWFWAADIVALIVFGVLSDVLKVRKPLMLVGAIGSIVMLLFFIQRANHPYSSFHQIIFIEVLLAAFISLTFAPWMAGYTEMVEAKNPALVGTGLALWGWILRLTVALSFIFLPVVVTSVNPVVDNLQYSQTTINGQPFNAQQFQIQHPQSVAFAEANASWLKVLQEPAVAPVVAALNANLTAANLAAFQKAVPAVVYTKTLANATKLKVLVVPYEAQLGYLGAHQGQLNDLLKGVGQSPKQWQNWFWVCLGGMVLFIPSIWLNRGRWSPARAREDEKKHDADVEAEFKQLVGANA
ncbi:MAG TPA: MFS transporter [Acidimicrobiales bacterium]